MASETDISGLRESGPDVLVCRSGIDREVWYCWPGGVATDQADWGNPGRLRAVQAYAERQYADGHRVRWQRVDIDTWRMCIASGQLAPSCPDVADPAT